MRKDLPVQRRNTPLTLGRNRVFDIFDFEGKSPPAVFSVRITRTQGCVDLTIINGAVTASIMKQPARFERWNQSWKHVPGSATERVI